jgi:arabinose-5-phosphate isomerase
MGRPIKEPAGSSFRRSAARVLEIESLAVAKLAERLDGEFDRAVELLTGCQGRVVVTGMGKSGIICQKIASTLSSTGTPSLFMHPAEALHGDLGMLISGDVLLAVSNSGETDEVVRLLELVRRLAARIVSMTGNPESTLARHSDVHLHVGVDSEACPLDLVPTASTCAALAMGDALAVCCYESRGFTEQDYARFHPGGSLGRKLTLVRSLMHTGDDVPVVTEGAPMKQAVETMSDRGLGMTCVTDGEGRLSGILTDGDLRRRLIGVGDPLAGDVGDAMTRSPRTIAPDAFAAEALQVMEELTITSLPVVDLEQRLVGVIQIHDLWRTELF